MAATRGNDTGDPLHTGAAGSYAPDRASDHRVARVLDVLADLRERPSRLGVGVTDDGSVVVMVVDGDLDQVLALVAVAGCPSAPQRVRVPQAYGGAVLLEWAPGQIAGVAVRLTWLVTRPRRAASLLERVAERRSARRNS